MAQRNKPRITITVDPDVLEEVDAYIKEHEGTDRSKVMDEALRCWYARLLHDALVRQHSAPKSPEEMEERAAWKRIRAAQMVHLGRKYDEHGKA
ncbi:MAG: hypothetical protein HYX94_02890 [Chloroflexi bacterium]|nr:hypothetical protein [Chloroflexota bacterium]